MPFISEAASAIKSRFGFQDRSSEPLQPVRSTPDLVKSVSKENVNHSSFSTSAIRSIGERDDHGVAVSSGSASQSFEFSEDPTFWKDHNVQVIIRIRPLSSSEISLQGNSKCIRQESSQTITWTGHPESRFTFDIVADENVSQEKLFKAAGVHMVENCVGGYNSCMFAYGQTGSGKTHTMLGDIEGGIRRHSVNCGMTPRVFEYLFHRIQKEKEARREEKLRFTCKCSFLEIYNEQILDLLDPSSVNLQIREDTKKGVYVENLKEIEVTSARDVMQQLIQGAANRKVAATNMNRASSRSHSVFTCIIESKWESQGVTHHRFARLNLVDLAGSERQKSSGAEGERLKEATNINKSLSTLGLVIMNLVNMSNGKSLHVPYRDSKLTFLLQDSLGGNSKTIIIANVTPSSCCSLETLSTLKFAQRAKFIKNNAIVNEDTSGDVLVMRMQIQQLKKEVSRLRGLGNGGAEYQDTDTLSVGFPGSPGSFKWEGLHGSSSPLTSNKRVSHKKDYEVALVGAFRREKDKDIALQALTAENQAVMQLAKQREDEIQGLKMRLRFREAGIKRLESVAFGKISAETHLLKENEEHLKEIEVLRGQVDRNQEVTRFAMENLRLKEEIRRLKTFCEEGERETMNEQITTLQNKLLEALDWKLMHESDSSTFERRKLDEVTNSPGVGNLLISNQEPGSPWRSSVNEENEFLRMQAIQNQSEMDSLRKKLTSCLEEKEKLERNANGLMKELEEMRCSKAIKEETQKLQTELPSLLSDAPNIDLNDQIELKTMVDAIGAASQREAQAHETAVLLSKENDELRIKLKVLIEDNSKLIELYERAVAETNHEISAKVEQVQEDDTEDQTNNGSLTEYSEEKEMEMKKVVEKLEHQLMDLHEENDKLMGLYEKAMQERDEARRISLEEAGLSRLNKQDESILHCDNSQADAENPSDVGTISGIEIEQSTVTVVSDKAENAQGDHAEDHTNNGGLAEYLEEKQMEMKKVVENLEHQLLDLHDENEKLMGLYEKAMQERDEARILMEEACVSRLNLPDESIQRCGDPQDDAENQSDGCFNTRMEEEPSTSTVPMVKVLEDLELVRTKLDGAQEKLFSSARTVAVFGAVEKTIIKADKLSREIKAIEDGIQVKHYELETLKVLSSEMQDRRALTNKKLLAIRYSLSSFSSSVVYFEQREVRARAKVNDSSSYVDKKKEELARLQSCKEEIEANGKEIQQSEVELRNRLQYLKAKHEEENQRQENEKVLLAIDNVEKADILPLQKNWHLGGKATELLKSEEEKTKLQTEMRQSREKLGIIRKEIEDLNRRLGEVKSEMQVVEMKIQKGLKSVKEMELGLQGIIREKEIVLEMKENGKNEIESVIIEYHQSIFEAELKEAEMEVLEEELLSEVIKKEEIQTVRSVVTGKTTELLEGMGCRSSFLSEKMEAELQNVRTSVVEARSLLDITSDES